MARYVPPEEFDAAGRAGPDDGVPQGRRRAVRPLQLPRRRNGVTTRRKEVAAGAVYADTLILSSSPESPTPGGVHELGIVLAAALAAPEPAAPSGVPPSRRLAIIDGEGRLSITLAGTHCYGPQDQETTVDASENRGAKKSPVRVKVSSVTLITAELPAKYVEAYTVDGSAIRERSSRRCWRRSVPSSSAMDGKKVDPFHLQLYKEGTIVLVPPANALSIGAAMFGGGPDFGPPLTQPIPFPCPAVAG